jgi:hypothetical protein
VTVALVVTYLLHILASARPDFLSRMRALQCLCILIRLSGFRPFGHKQRLVPRVSSYPQSTSSPSSGHKALTHTLNVLLPPNVVPPNLLSAPDPPQVTAIRQMRDATEAPVECLVSYLPIH